MIPKIVIGFLLGCAGLLYINRKFCNFKDVFDKKPISNEEIQRGMDLFKNERNNYTDLFLDSGLKDNMDRHMFRALHKEIIKINEDIQQSEEALLSRNKVFAIDSKINEIYQKLCEEKKTFLQLLNVYYEEGRKSFSKDKKRLDETLRKAEDAKDEILQLESALEGRKKEILKAQKSKLSKTAASTQVGDANLVTELVNALPDKPGELRKINSGISNVILSKTAAGNQGGDANSVTESVSTLTDKPEELRRINRGISNAILPEAETAHSKDGRKFFNFNDVFEESVTDEQLQNAVKNMKDEVSNYTSLFLDAGIKPQMDRQMFHNLYKKIIGNDKDIRQVEEALISRKKRFADDLKINEIYQTLCAEKDNFLDLLKVYYEEGRKAFDKDMKKLDKTLRKTEDSQDKIQQLDSELMKKKQEIVLKTNLLVPQSLQTNSGGMNSATKSAKATSSEEPSVETNKTLGQPNNSPAPEQTPSSGITNAPSITPTKTLSEQSKTAQELNNANSSESGINSTSTEASFPKSGNETSTKSEPAPEELLVG